MRLRLQVFICWGDRTDNNNIIFISTRDSYESIVISAKALNIIIPSLCVTFYFNILTLDISNTHKHYKDNTEVQDSNTHKHYKDNTEVQDSNTQANSASKSVPKTTGKWNRISKPSSKK